MPLLTSLAATPMARERDGEAGGEDAHDDRDGGHDREVGGDATGVGTLRGALEGERGTCAQEYVAEP